MFKIGDLYSHLQRKTVSTAFIPQIDGLRFLALLLVIFEHINTFVTNKVVFAASVRPQAVWPLYYMFYINGRKGVLLFFAISGFILAMPFAKAFWQNGKPVSIKKYFLRRLTRLEPPYILTVLALAVLLVFFGSHQFGSFFPDKSFWGLFPVVGSSLIYMHNILFVNQTPLSPVLWSLEIEIQFYILLPVLVLILKLPKIYRRTILTNAIVLAILLQHIFPTPYLAVYNFIQYFLLGFLLLDFYLNGWQLKISRSLSFTGGLLMLAAMPYLDLYSHLYNEYIFIVLLFGVFMLALTDGLWKRIFSLRWLAIIGGMCYSIYLWHDTVISAVGNHITFIRFAGSYPLTLLVQSAIMLPCVLVFCGVFYLLIERPCMDKDWPVKLWRFFKQTVFGKSNEEVTLAK